MWQRRREQVFCVIAFILAQRILLSLKGTERGAFLSETKNHPFLPTQAVCKEQKKENTWDLSQTPFMFNFHLKRLRHISMWQLTLRDVKLLAVIKLEWL